MIDAIILVVDHLYLKFSENQPRFLVTLLSLLPLNWSDRRGNPLALTSLKTAAGKLPAGQFSCCHHCLQMHGRASTSCVRE